MMKKFAFADTSIFLHFHPLDQIDLVEILQCDAVELVIPPVVTEELEQQGWDHPSLSIRKRAQYCLRKIRSWLQTSDGLIRPGVEVTFCQGPKDETIRDHNLTRSADDLVIANVLEYKRVHGRESVVLLTHDVRRQLKAHRYDLESVSLPAEAMLPQVSEAARVEAGEPRRERARFDVRAPRLELRFANGSRMLDVRPRDEDLLTEELILARLDELRVWCEEPLRFRQIKAMPGVGDREAASMLTNALLIPEEEYERYERQLETFLEACGSWLRRRAQMMDSMRRTVKLDFELVNSGNLAAEGIVLTLILPKKLHWLEVLGEGQLPEPPEPPAPPRTHMEIVRESLSDLYRATLPPWSAGLETYELPVDDTWMIEGQELRGLVDECLDQRAVELNPVYALFVDADEIANFAISYVINQKNVSEPVDGKLLVRVP
jgi:hypothetical protein